MLNIFITNIYIDNLVSNTNFINQILNNLLIPNYNYYIGIYYYIRIERIEEKTEFIKLLI